MKIKFVLILFVVYVIGFRGIHMLGNKLIDGSVMSLEENETFNFDMINNVMYERIEEGVNIVIEYPQFSNVNNSIIVEINSIIQEAALSDFYERWILEGLIVEGLTLEQSYTIEMFNDSILSIIFNQYSYVAQNASPSHLIYAVTIDLKSGLRNTLFDFIETYECLESLILSCEYEVTYGELMIFEPNHLWAFVQSYFSHAPSQNNIQNFYISEDGSLCIIFEVSRAGGGYSVVVFDHDVSRYKWYVLSR
jgi:hypothetical protein